MRDPDKLAVYRCAERLALEVYRTSASLPIAEKYELVTQMRRAAVSVASNIAEGSARSSDSDFARFVEISLGSARELKYQIRLVEQLHYSQAELGNANALCDEVIRMLGGLLLALRAKGRCRR